MANDYDEIRSDEYETATEAAQLGLLLVNTVDEHSHLRADSCRLAYLFRDEEVARGGKTVWASAHLVASRPPAGRYWSRFIRWSLVNILGYEPTFLVLIDRNIWAGLDARQKLALIDHELMHCSQATDQMGEPRYNQVTGDPIWALREHDIEEFDSIVTRHGLWKQDLVDSAKVIIEALNHGPALSVPADLQEKGA